MFTVFQWFFNRKTLIKILPSIGRFYANETPRTDDFYRHKTLDFSRRAAATEKHFLSVVDASSGQSRHSML